MEYHLKNFWIFHSSFDMLRTDRRFPEAVLLRPNRSPSRSGLEIEGTIGKVYQLECGWSQYTPPGPEPSNFQQTREDFSRSFFSFRKWGIAPAVLKE